METKPLARLAAAISAVLFVVGCADSQPEPEPPTPGLVEVVARGLSFSAPDTIPSGWVTLRFRNESPMTHFAVLERLPDGVDLEAQQRDLAPAFQAGMDLLAAGRADEAGVVFGELPAWFGEVVFTGGPGLTAPGHTSETTVRLEPGTYLIECYVKTAGTFHSYSRDTSAYGMVHEFTVTQSASPAPEPEAALRVALSSERGMEITGNAVAGRQTVAVEFTDQAAYENFAGHDLHLARLADSVEVADVVAWMDWRQSAGLGTPAPAEFLGGVSEMPAGNIGYLTVDLTPGRYLWIAEVPDAEAKGLTSTFTVAGPDGPS